MKLHLTSRELASQLDTLCSHQPRLYPVRQVLTDSRSWTSSEGTAFFALKTSSGDGHRYIPELYSRGVRVFVVMDELEPMVEAWSDATLIQVSDTLVALQQLAILHRERIEVELMGSLPIVGITGSNGKTIVKEMLYQLLSGCYQHITRSPGSYNSQLGVPLSVLQLTSETDLALFEAGISQPGEMERLAQIIAPDYVVITHIGQAHSHNFSSPSELIREKLKLAQAGRTRRIITSLMDRQLLQEIETLGLSSLVVGYTLGEGVGERGLVHADYRYEEEGVHLWLNYQGQVYEVDAPFSDEASLNNLLLSLTAITSLAPHCWHRALQGISSLAPMAMRLELQDSLRKATIINDSYSCDVDALAIALDFMYRRARLGQYKGRMALVLSDIDPFGGATEAYQMLPGMLERYDVHRVYAIGAGIAQLADLAPMLSVSCFDSVEDFLSAPEAEEAISQYDYLLIKGARRFGFERIVSALSRREHQTQLEVNLQALRSNLAYYRSLLPIGHSITCMIKADAYGLGAYEVARSLEEAQVTRLAVALVDEGKMLRERGIRTPIIVMNPEVSSLETLLRYRLDMEVYSLELMERVLRLGRKLGYYPVLHLKVETGMHRLGLSLEDIPRLAELYAMLGGEAVEMNVFSHLAVADVPGMDEFSYTQAERLKLFETELRAEINRRLPQSKLSQPLEMHLLNTAGVERFASSLALNGVRLGIGLYGDSPTGSLSIEPVANLSTTILQIKSVAPHCGIGYGQTDVRAEARRIAILPIGYADGLPRRLGNGRWSMLLRGKLCPIVGRICMDICMIDITDAPEAQVGDKVIVFGHEEVSLQRLALAADTISYEILTGISPRVPRLYRQS